MKQLKNEKGMVLAMLIGFLSILTVGFTAMTALTTSQLTHQRQTVKSTEAFYLAEAAIQRSKVDLSNNFAQSPSASEGVVFPMGEGEFYFDIEPTANPDVRIVTGYGAVPSFADPDQVRSVQLEIQSVATQIGMEFDYAIFASDTIDINGSANTVDGDIFAGNNIDCSPASCPGVTGDQTEEGENDYPFPALDMDAMKAIAISQGNYFATTPTADQLPTSFYYTPPAGASLGVPNIVFIEGSMTLSGGEQVGGFIIVAGDYANNPDDPQGNVTMNGSSVVDGTIYAMGNSTTNGGGNSHPTITGAIYSKSIVTLNGKPTVANDQSYANALEGAEFDIGEIAGSGWNEVTVPDAIKNPA